jgi:hypothetical protein
MDRSAGFRRNDEVEDVAESDWLAFLRDVILTEENTDRLIDILRERIDIPGVPDRFVWMVVDRMLPELILDALAELDVDEDSVS